MATICFFCVLCGTRLHASSESSDDLMECHACSRHVPVPRLASFFGRAKDYPTVFPAEVLDLTVKFRCTKCQTSLRADARWEGRTIVCPDCGATTGIPCWSTGPGGGGTSKPHRAAPMPVMGSDIKAVTLSTEEVDFLSGQPSGNLGATR